MQRCITTFINAILAGILIGIGGTVYLSVNNPIIGAILFTVGLFTICTFNLPLYTGKICDILHNDKYYAINVVYTWFGNLIGTWLFANLEKMTRHCYYLQEKAIAICNTKLSDTLIGIFILSVFCNIMIFIAVKGFHLIDNCVGKYIALFLGVSVFIICGFEHCVANMYYFSIAGMWNMTTLAYLIVMSLGNTIGGILMSAYCRLERGVKE